MGEPVTGALLSSDTAIRALLQRVRRIALLGASANEDRPSNEVMHWLLQQGYDVVPVNPGLAGRKIHGQTVYAHLADVPAPIDMLDVFRASDALPGIVDEAIAERARLNLSAIWTQLGVVDEAAAAKAAANGFEVVMNRCPKIEWRRLQMARTR